MAKSFKLCLCGCGLSVRQYGSRPSKFYNREHYLNYSRMKDIWFDREIRILSLRRRKK